jgi:hypothetical protein
LDETLQDSIWLDHVDDDVSEREPFGGLVLQQENADRSFSQYRKLTAGSWCDETIPPHSLLVSDCSPDRSFSTLDFSVGKFSIDSNRSSINSTSPIDVRFEFGDIQSSQLGDSIADTALQVVDYVDGSQGFSSISSQPVQSIRPLFSLGSYDEQIPAACSPDNLVPASPIFLEESCSPFDDLECDEHDTLHDQESVCRLLRAIDGSTHSGARFLDSVGTMLSHVSPEEVESVLSRDSSSGNLLALKSDSLARDTSSLAIDSGFLVGSGVSDSHSSGINAMRTCISSPFAVVNASSLATSSIATSSLMTDSIANSFTAIDSIANSLSVINSEYRRAQVTNKLTPLLPHALTSGPYHVGEVLSERRVRKKEQNKTAALRYRQKRREEKGHTMSEVEELEQKNAELKNRAEELTKEIGYLRGLLEEITRV